MTDQQWTWSDVEAQVKPRSTTVDLCLDGTIQARLDETRRRVQEARQDDALDAGSSAAQSDLAELEREAAEATRTFNVVACGHRRWRELLVEHRSDDPNERYDTATFVPAAIAECVAQFPSPADVVKAQEVLTSGQIGKLFAAVKRLNEGTDQVPSTRGR